jgi:hypothetical protein
MIPKTQIPAITPIQLLDEVLTFICVKPIAKGNIEQGKLITELKKVIPLIDIEDDFASQILRVFDKLEKENYIICEQRNVRYNDLSGEGATRLEYCYRVTFDGKLFFEQGGYSKKYAHDESERNRLTALESSQLEYNEAQRKQAATLNKLTFWVAVGTLLAAVYYMTELYWNHGWFHFGHH